MNKSVVAIIPARGGSKGVPGKNIKLLAGYPLIAYSIAAAKLSKNIGRIIVSTDSREIASIAERFGAEVPFMRPSAIATDSATDLDFMLHALNWLKENDPPIPEYWVHLRPTTPLRDPALIDKALAGFIENPEATSLRSAHKAPESPFKWFAKNEEGYFDALSAAFSADYINNPRQGFPEAYIPDGYVDVLKSSFIFKNNLLHGDKIMAFVSPSCVEVDAAEDFETLEYQIEKKGSPLLEQLKENYPGAAS